MQKTQSRVYKVLFIAGGFFCAFALIELLLGFGLLDNYPLWNPGWAKLEDQRINQENWNRAKAHPLLFNDYVVEKSKSPNLMRIVVLGDSFVWGDGLPQEQRWGVILSKHVSDCMSNVQFLQWGRPGWSTKDQLEFLKTEGLTWKPDLIILGLVTNDPDLGDIEQIIPTWQEAKLLWPIRAIFPETSALLSSLINNNLQRFNSKLGYQAWEDQLYSAENLARYKTVVHELAELLRDAQVKILVAFTPNNQHQIFAEKYAKLEPIFSNEGFNLLNLWEPLAEDFFGQSYLSLQANRGNGHPGAALNKYFANKIFQQLIRQGLIPKSCGVSE